MSFLSLQGAPAISDFRLNKLQQELSEKIVDLEAVSASYWHFVKSASELDEEEIEGGTTLCMNREFMECMQSCPEVTLEDLQKQLTTMIACTDQIHVWTTIGCMHACDETVMKQATLTTIMSPIVG